MPTYENEPAAGTAGLAKYTYNGMFFNTKPAPGTQAQKNAIAHIVSDLFEDADYYLGRMRDTLSCARAANKQADLAANLRSMRRYIDDIFIALDGIEKLAAPQPSQSRFWLRIAGKKFYESRSFYLSQEGAKELFHRAARLEIRDDGRVE